MSEPKFTPGPWHINFNDYTKPYIAILNEDNVVIAQIPDGEVIRGDTTILGIENIEANVDLIAAAPDMYEALEQMEPLINNSTGIVGYYMNGNIAKWNDFDVTRIIGNALRKARGEME